MRKGIRIALILGVGGLLTGLALLVARQWGVGMAVVAPSILLAVWAAEQDKRSRS